LDCTITQARQKPEFCGWLARTGAPSSTIPNVIQRVYNRVWISGFQEIPMAQLTERGSLVAGTFAAVGASVCCVGPLVLLLLGVGGTWIGSLTAMEPLRPYFIGLTLLFLGLAFRKLYLMPQPCAPGAACANPAAVKRRRFTFWIVGAMLLVLLAVPWFATLFY
jgi:mercuric ion transport protein